MPKFLFFILLVFLTPAAAAAYSCAILDTNTVREGGIVIVKVSSSARLQAGEVRFMGNTYPLFFKSFDRANLDFEFVTIVPVPLETEGVKKMKILWMADSKKREQEEYITVKKLKLPPSALDTKGKAGNFSGSLKEENRIINKKQENITKVKYSLPFIMPAKGEISSAFGKPRIYDNGAGWRHKGVDIAAPEGSPVFAASGGDVVMANTTKAHGIMIIIDHGGGVYSLYHHLRGVSVKTGDKVKQGERIGSVGSTGIVTGPHLHWQVNIFGIPIDPMYLISAR